MKGDPQAPLPAGVQGPGGSSCPLRGSPSLYFIPPGLWQGQGSGDGRWGWGRGVEQTWEILVAQPSTGKLSAETVQGEEPLPETSVEPESLLGVWITALF